MFLIRAIYYKRVVLGQNKKFYTKREFVHQASLIGKIELDKLCNTK